MALQTNLQIEKTEQNFDPDSDADNLTATESSPLLSRDANDVLKNIVLQAYQSKASDVHIEPQDKNVLIRFRIDGILNDVFTLDKKFEQTLIFVIKVNAKLRTDEHFAPQDGKIQFHFDNKIDTRISLLPTTKGEKVVIRLLTQTGNAYDLESLGVNDKDLDIIKRSYMKPYGSIFVCGPTGSGKTTTLYSIIKTINSREKNITTIEDPVEYEIEGVNHIQINPKAGLTFERGLRSILRQDPDIVMVGEIRDAETAKIAINAAMTGHLVLSTIHTNDSVTTIPRLVDMGVDPYLVASTVNMVIAQRLARKLCNNCKQQVALTQENYVELQKIRPDIVELIKPNEVFFNHVGCDQCKGSGYRGRIGLYEVLEVTENVRKIIMENANVDSIFNKAREQGLILIMEDGVNKLREGIISLSELLRVTALKT